MLGAVSRVFRPGVKFADFCDLWKKMVVECKDGGTIVARGFVGPARLLRNSYTTKHAYNTAKDAPGSYVGIPDEISDLPEYMLEFEHTGMLNTYKGDEENALAGAGECAQRITDLPKTKDMVEKIVADAEKYLRNAKNLYVD